MSDDEYSSEEERHQGRGHRQAGRRAHNVSLSTEEEEEVGAHSWPVHNHSAKEITTKDVAGPYLSRPS